MYQIKHPKLADALYLAFQIDPFYKLIKATIMDDLGEGATENDGKQAMLAYMDYSICEAEQFGESYVPSQQSYGISVWLKPRSKQQEKTRETLKEQFILDNIGPKTLALYQKVSRFMGDNAADQVDPGAWYLSTLGILPDFQGQGLGPSLIEDVLTKTDQLGVSTYLETFAKKNLNFYLRLGYQILDSFIEPVTGAEYWLLQRSPDV